MLSATDALQRLRAGNKRFISGSLSGDVLSSPDRRNRLVGDQKPYAIILGCSDSRVPAEIVFDQGLGDLFVIRVAGNIVAPSQIGSVEFAAELFGTRLVVVLGHSRCGAIQATIDALTGPAQDGGPRSRNLRSIVGRVRPAIESLVDSSAGLDPDTLMAHAVRANIRASVNQLRHGSEVLEELLQEEGLMVVGAEYSLDTGEVDFFDYAHSDTP
jgi:carbonic anhydrase